MNFTRIRFPKALLLKLNHSMSHTAHIISPDFCFNRSSTNSYGIAYDASFSKLNGNPAADPCHFQHGPTSIRVMLLEIFYLRGEKRKNEFFVVTTFSRIDRFADARFYTTEIIETLHDTDSILYF